jgi:hypothetical protein
MAHHVAELIETAEKGKTAAERARAQEQAVETILKIWDHRTSLPGTAYPLAGYGDVLRVLDRLRPGENPFRYIAQTSEAKREQLAAELFDSLTRLVIALLLPKLPSKKPLESENDVVIEALSDLEQRVLNALGQWAELFEPADESTGRTRRRKKGKASPHVDLDEAAVRLIDRLADILVELRNELVTPA